VPKIGLLTKVKIRKRRTTHTGEYPSGIAKRRLPKGGNLKMAEGDTKKPTGDATKPAKNLGEAVTKTAKTYPTMLLRFVAVFGGLAGGRFASRVFPQVSIFSGNTIGQGVISFVTGVTSYLTRNKYKAVSEAAGFGTLGIGAGFVESLAQDLIALSPKKKEEPAEGKIFDLTAVPRRIAELFKKV